MLGLVLVIFTQAQNRQQEIQSLVNFLNHPNLVLKAENLNLIEGKVQKLSQLLRTEYAQLSLEERRKRPEVPVLRKWMRAIRDFKQQQTMTSLDQQIQNLEKIDKSVDLINLTKLMEKEMQEAKQRKKWQGWSMAVKQEYQRLKSQGKISQELVSYYEALNR